MNERTSEHKIREKRLCISHIFMMTFVFSNFTRENRTEPVNKNRQFRKPFVALSDNVFTNVQKPQISSNSRTYK